MIGHPYTSFSSTGIAAPVSSSELDPGFRTIG